MKTFKHFNASIRIKKKKIALLQGTLLLDLPMSYLITNNGNPILINLINKNLKYNLNK